ncbi:MAG: hypothetical protein V1726_02270 [Methanobacteriota archaeon]
MNKKEDLRLTEGSSYRVYSIGGRDTVMETEGILKGFANLGIDEAGLLIELSAVHEKLQGTQRIIPLHAILAIDILSEKKLENKEDEKDPAHYYG